MRHHGFAQRLTPEDERAGRRVRGERRHTRLIAIENQQVPGPHGLRSLRDDAPFQDQHQRRLTRW